MGWLSGWSKRQAIVLTGGSSGAQVDFQVKLSIAYDSDMLSDFSDLRFTQEDGTTLIDAWLEEKIDSTSTDVWVEFPSTPANGVEQTYYMYYVKADAVSDWDIGKTFLFGDDFSGVPSFGRISYDTLWSGSGATDWLGRPSLVKNGDIWIVVYRQADAHIGDGNSLCHIRFSDDEGTTWTEPDKLLNGSDVTGFPIAGTDSQDLEGASIILAPNGDLLVQSLERIVGGDLNGTYQYRSTDDGATWTSEGRINDDPLYWGGHGADYVVVGSTIYQAIISHDDDGTSLYKSTDNGATWTFVSDISTSNTNEPGIEYLGNDTLLVLLRTADKTKTYQRKSTDMGATWGTLTDITSQVGIFQHPWLHIYPDEPDRIYAVGRDDYTLSEYTVVYCSDDGGDTWIHKFYPDPDSYEDAAYCDMMKRDNGDFYLLSYGGTTDTASIKQYIFDKSGLTIDPEKWDTSGAPTVSGGAVHLSNSDWITGKTAFGNGYCYEAMSKADEQDIALLAAVTTIGSCCDDTLLFSNSDADYLDDFDMFLLSFNRDSSEEQVYKDVWNDFRNTYYHYRIIKVSDSEVIMQQETNTYTYTNQAHIPTGNLKIAGFVWDSSQESTLDMTWAFVRKYAANPPTYEFGSEENAPIGASHGLHLIAPYTLSSSSDAGETGTIVYDSDYMYVCVATNTWKRVSISTW